MKNKIEIAKMREKSFMKYFDTLQKNKNIIMSIALIISVSYVSIFNHSVLF